MSDKCAKQVAQLSIANVSYSRHKSPCRNLSLSVLIKLSLLSCYSEQTYADLRPDLDGEH